MCLTLYYSRRFVGARLFNTGKVLHMANAKLRLGSKHLCLPNSASVLFSFFH